MYCGVALRLRRMDSSSTIWPTAYHRADLSRYKTLVLKLLSHVTFWLSIMCLPRDHLLHLDLPLSMLWGANISGVVTAVVNWLNASQLSDALRGRKWAATTLVDEGPC